VRVAGLERRVHFTDYIADDELPAVYNLASAFVFPSRYEGFGLTPLEAMACGTPVVSSDAASLPEVVGDAGILVPPNDATGYARAMSDLSADDAQRAELRRRGLARARAFTWERAALETDRVYRQVVDAHHA
jgi:glycosyltransferase involved in cell wall biosynthesis